MTPEEIKAQIVADAEQANAQTEELRIRVNKHNRYLRALNKAHDQLIREHLQKSGLEVRTDYLILTTGLGGYQPDEHDRECYRSRITHLIIRRDAPRISSVEIQLSFNGLKVRRRELVHLDDGSTHEIGDDVAIWADSSTDKCHAAYERSLRLPLLEQLWLD